MKVLVTLILIILVFASALSVGLTQVAIAQDSHCPGDEIPKTDSNGEPVLNPTTHEPECVPGP